MNHPTTWMLKIADGITAPLKGITELTNKLRTNFGTLRESSGSDMRKMGNSIAELRDRLRQLSLDQETAGDLPALRKINREIQNTERQLGSLQNVGRGGGLAGFAGMATTLAAVSAAGAAGLGLATSKALEFDTAMSELNSTLLKSPEELKKLSRQLVAVGEGKGVDDIAKIPAAFNRIVSAGFDTKQALSMLEPTLYASAAGFTDVEETAAALSGIMSVVKDVTPTRAFDVMFAAVNLGNAKFKELKEYMPSLIPTGQALGFTYEDVAGTFSFLTAKGNEASKSATLMGNAFTALSRPQTVATLQKVGVSVFDVTGKMRPMVSIVQDISKKLAAFKPNDDFGRLNMLASFGIDDAQAKEFFNVASQNVDDLRRITEGVTVAEADGMGMLQKTYLQTDGAARTLADTKYQLSAIMLEIGQMVLPPFVKVLGAAGEMLKWARRNGEWLKPVVVGLAVSLGVFTAAVWASNIALMANPAVLVVTAIVAAVTGLVAALTYCYFHFDKFRRIVDSVFSFIKNFVIGIINHFGMALSAVGELIGAISNGEWSKAATAGGKLLVAVSPVGLAAAVTQSTLGAARAASDTYNGVAVKPAGAAANPVQPDAADILTEDSLKQFQGPKPDAKSPEQQLNDRMNKPGGKFELPADKKNRGGGMDSVAGGIGGEKPRSVTVTIQNLSIMPNAVFGAVREGIPDLKSLITEAVVDAVRDAEIIIGN